MQAKMILVPILCVLLMLFVAPGSIFAETISGDPAVTQSETTEPTGDTSVLVPNKDTTAEEAGARHP
ncbi:hypothetical protein LPY66_19155 [Dehalobacter sp. DCM]|uniref:hypothetical protein n=1 Tax=Dehalobacter sp. DCM TaxID=2907827 RepID=UPI003081EA5A|nr:hypothetical protein LPY66_19155 [Dehalobacter sp. DCM]